MAKAYEDGSGWAFRLRVQGQDIDRGGFKSQKVAQEEADGHARDLRKSDKQALLDLQRTSVAQALSDYAREVLPHYKGAPQEARRINRYTPITEWLQYAGR
ncbi:hypothetical protein [Roseateles koreensis]|uniref:Uncharacterized protein n=1 Tax=Roseateles koreensis TaxID=2987526 RepID=A0ABT5KWC8_9BURK|nr:hypothetical protein [Roseateles koreensis]MDC8787245.1 hypothetical protein [Roseateles koreensis]